MRTRLAIAVALVAAQTAYAEVIEEVIVTAQKRAESVMDVPIAITAFTGETLEGMGTKNLTDVGRFTAGVDMNNDKSLQPAYAIRGVQTNDWTIGSDPAVAVYVDNVYAARAAGAEAALFDVERIEILKGPQGTLFGRNATGGAIHIITKKPSFDTEGHIKLTGGNYDRHDIEGVYNTALTEKVALRMTGSLRKRDGYLENLYGSDLNDEDKQTVHAALLWDVSDATEVLLRAGYENMDQASGVLHTTNSAAWLAANPGHDYDQFGDVAYDAPQLEKRDLYTASAEINHQFDDMTFTSITAYRKFETELLEDLDGSNNPDFYFASSNPEESKFFSQELRLTGDADKLKWTLGAVYTSEEIEHTTEARFLVSTFESFALPPVFATLGRTITPEEIPEFRATARAGTNPLLNSLLGPICQGKNCDGIAASFFISSLPGVTQNPFQILAALGPRIAAGYAEPWNEEVDSSGDYSSAAIYGDATWSITDATNLTGGLRYTYDDKTFDLYTAYQNYLIEPDPANGEPGVPFGIAFFNGGVPLLDTSEEENWGSLSGRLVLDHHFTDEVMGYASIANGFKSGGFNSLNFGPGIETSYDAEEVTNYEVGVKGSALEGSMQYSSALFFYKYDNLQTLDLIGTPIPSYNLRNADAEGKGFEVELEWLLGEYWMLTGNYSYLKTEFTQYNIIPAAGETPADDLTGEPRAESPENKVNAGVQYSHPVADAGDITARVDYTWVDDRVAVTRGPVESYDQVNARLSFITKDLSWEVALWGTNLGDTEVLTSYGNGGAVNSMPGWRLAPRMYGVDLVYNF